MGFLVAVATSYLLVTLFFAYLVHRIPRSQVKDPPDWGKLVDTRVSSVDGGFLEVWKVEPDAQSRGTIVLVHGWGRNRDSMVSRARMFGELGFTTVMYSSRDHGGSTAYRFMNPFRFAEDVESLLEWVHEPVLLYGHSVGAAAALIAAERNPRSVRLLFLEACYARTKEGIRSLHRSYNRFLGVVFSPMVVTWMDIFYGFKMDAISPERLAANVDIPTLIIHGEEDQGFPLHYAWRVRDSFPAGRAEFFVGKGADHSSSSLTPEYPIAIRSFVERHMTPDSSTGN